MTKGQKLTRRILAHRMRVLRAANGWSQEALADVAGLHRTYISAIERMEYNVGIDNIEKIARAFDVNINQLLAPISKGSGEPQE